MRKNPQAGDLWAAVDAPGAFVWDGEQWRLLVSGNVCPYQDIEPERLVGYTVGRYDADMERESRRADAAEAALADALTESAARPESDVGPVAA